MANRVKIKTSDLLKIDNIQPVAVYNSKPKSLPLDKKLPSPSIAGLSCSSFSMNITVTVPAFNQPLNIYLYRGDRKYDMYYNVKAGDYTFRTLSRRNNSKIEIFFTAGLRKSSSIMIVQI